MGGSLVQGAFSELLAIFAHYCKSVGGAVTAEDAVEMTMSEFKDLVKDVGLETKDLRFDVMCNMFIKANATNSNAAHEQMRTKRVSTGIKDKSTSGGADKKEVSNVKGNSDGTEAVKDQELVLLIIDPSSPF